MLDYDDLLLYWHALLDDPTAGPIVRKLFDCVLVDEYQDTNTLQAEILYRLSPEGKGLTVVGDDAQSIYSFRAATVRNILDFPKHYPDTTIVTLEQNYRSTQPILEATNRVIGAGPRAIHQEPLVPAGARASGPCWSPARTRTSRPNTSSARFSNIARRASTLRRQAVLFRASHHSMLLEAELAARQYSLPQVWRAEVRRDGPRQGPDGLPAVGREPARRGGRRAVAAACCRASDRARRGS